MKVDSEVVLIMSNGLFFNRFHCLKSGPLKGPLMAWDSFVLCRHSHSHMCATTPGRTGVMSGHSKAVASPHCIRTLTYIDENFHAANMMGNDIMFVSDLSRSRYGCRTRHGTYGLSDPPWSWLTSDGTTLLVWQLLTKARCCDWQWMCTNLPCPWTWLWLY